MKAQSNANVTITYGFLNFIEAANIRIETISFRCSSIFINRRREGTISHSIDSSQFSVNRLNRRTHQVNPLNTQFYSQSFISHFDEMTAIYIYIYMQRSISVSTADKVQSAMSARVMIWKWSECTMYVDDVGCGAVCRCRRYQRSVAIAAIAICVALLLPFPIKQNKLFTIFFSLFSNHIYLWISLSARAVLLLVLSPRLELFTPPVNICVLFIGITKLTLCCSFCEASCSCSHRRFGIVDAFCDGNSPSKVNRM